LDVVVHEREVVDEFERNGGGKGSIGARAKLRGGEEDEARAKELAGCVDGAAPFVFDSDVLSN